MGPKFNGWKLIRNKMPACSPSPMIVREVSGDEHVWYLKRKMEEESLEVAGATTAAGFIEEMADVRQVLSDYCAVTGLRVAHLRLPAIDGVPAVATDRMPFFRSQVDRVVELAHAMPDDEADLMDHVAETVAVLKLITDIAGIQDKVVATLKAKFEERGGFNPGVLWKKLQSP